MAFQKGHKPWNKGVIYTESQKNKLDLAGLLIGRLFKKGKLFVNSYGNVHYWVRKNKGTPQICENCGTTNGRLEWANKDHKYKHILDDYFALCCKCHREYDYTNHLCDKGSRGGSIPNKIKGVQRGV